MTTLQTKEQRQPLIPQAFIGLRFPTMSNFFWIPWGCIIVKLNHVSSFWKHTSETNIIYSLHSIFWAEERKEEKKKKAENSSDKSLAFLSGWAEKKTLSPEKNAQILTVWWSQHFQAEKVRKDWPNRTDRSRLILFCLSSLSFEGDEDNEPSYISPEGKPLKLTWITVFVYIQWLLTASKA